MIVSMVMATPTGAIYRLRGLGTSVNHGLTNALTITPEHQTIIKN